ncbi:hypothetical protein ACKWRH_03245 [Bradyrhizobium sp. Pa8]|uniref:hypothetical protein n=1 Tax=Bradyrhizobium sp. Pa8 TaxID=3386552 RepID=UPI00403F17D7
MSGDGSVAAWCVHRAGRDGCQAEFHCNYWRVAGDPDFKGKNGKVRDFVEFGIWLSDPNLIEKVNLFLPQTLANDALEDCGPHFARLDIAEGIFNEPLTCNSRRGPNSVELIKDSSPYCRVHVFPMDGSRPAASQLAITKMAEGTLLTVTREAIDEICTNLASKCPGYFRIRVYVEKKEPFVRAIMPRDRFLQSGFEEVEYVDFRFNEARTLPDRIESLMRLDHANASKVPFTRVAFLTAIPVLADLTLSSRQPHKNRLLEHGFWNDYVPSGIPDGMMVYHWRTDNTAGVEDFSAFVKLQTRRTGRQILWMYLLIAFAFGVMGNLSASALEALISSLWHALTNR